jgi:nitroimidazol reductase NimA-like FMN-containing flavoprotein (pyridoxamine 5'-phosphate oxidase superfamily)
MITTDPTPELDPRFSSPGAAPRPWSEARARLDEAEIYWLSTVRPDGRPHVTPIAAIWFREELVFGTGPTERKAHNLAANQKCVVTTGTNRLGEGFDVVVEGEAVRITDPEVLRPAADAIDAKYSGMFHWNVADDGGVHERTGEEVIVFRVVPVKAFGFERGKDTFGQTRWRFAEG